MKNFMLNIFGGPMVHGHRTVSSIKIGATVMVFALLIGWASFNKIMVKQFFTPSETIKVNFAANGVIRPYNSKVKVNFVPVGLVTGVEELADGSALYTVEIDPDVPAKLGTEPSAVIRPTTLLGGNYFIDLKSGGPRGEFTGTIPKERTALPIELGHVLAAIQPNAQVGLRGLVKKFDETLAGGGREALQRLVSDAPGSLRPTAEVVDALRGTNPDRDLTNVVQGLETTARALTDKPGQLNAVARDLGTTAASFGQQSPAVASALNELPGSLNSARNGLTRLNVTLDILRDTARDARPTAKELDEALDEVGPALEDARPVVEELRDVIHDAKPLVEDLVPISKDLTDTFEHVSGAPLDRVNGPVKDLVLNDYKGTGPYMQTGTDKKIFQELGYMVTNLDRATLMDRNGGALAFQPDLTGRDLLEGLIANDGRPRGENVAQLVPNSAPINPPLELPKPLQPQQTGGGLAGGQQQPQLPQLPALGGK